MTQPMTTQVIRLGEHDLDPAELITKLLRYAMRLTRGNVHRAEDLVNDTIVSLLRQHIANVDYPLAYARRTLYNQFVKDAKRDQLLVPSEPDAQVFEVLSSEDVYWELTSLDLRPLLDRLTAREQSVFSLLFDVYAGDFRAMDQELAAERLGISRTAVSSALNSLRNNLKSMLREQGVEE